MATPVLKSPTLSSLTSSTSQLVPLPVSLIASIERAVTGALQADFAHDPLLGIGLGSFNSVLSSAVKRHGGVVEEAICYALESSGRYIVLRQVEMPITDAAEALVASNSSKNLSGFVTTAFGPHRRVAYFDMIAIDTETGCATVVEIKRGSGTTEVKKRKLIERDLQCARLQLRSFLQPRYGCELNAYNSVLIDYYGRSGFPAALTVTREGIDALFGVPVMHLVDGVTARFRTELLRVVPRLLTIAQNMVTAETDGSLVAHPFANPVAVTPKPKVAANDDVGVAAPQPRRRNNRALPSARRAALQ